jgi:hypothetical protein
VERKDVLTDIAAALTNGLDWVEAEIAKIDGGGSTSGIKAIRADDFVEAIAVNTHLNWRKDLWGTNPAWKQPFLDLGVRYTRSGMFRNNGAIQDWKDIKAKLIYVSADGDQLEDKKAQVSETLNLLVENASITCAVEGPNEVNEGHHAGWETRTRDFQQWLFAEVNSRSAIAGKPILSPTIWSREKSAYELLGDISGMCDATNLHYYTGGTRPTITSKGENSDSAGTLDEAISDARGMAPGKPLWITETGWSQTGQGVALSQWDVTDLAAAKYWPRMVCEAFNRGVVRTAIYAFFDDDRSPPKYHGIMDRQFNKRKAYSGLKNMIAVFADPGASFEPGELALTMPTSVSHLPLMQRRDGSFLLAMWQDADSYNRQTFKDINVPPINVALDLGDSRHFRLFTPLDSGSPKDLPAGESVTVAVPDHLVVLEVT